MAVIGGWDLRLVVLSYVIAVFASYTALDLAGRVVATSGRVRRMWLTGGAFAMGTGIWAMHFTGMQAFQMRMPVTYDVLGTLLSMAIAIAASALALLVVVRGVMRARQLLVAGPIMGVGIASMHYTGMAAMQMPATISYDPPLFALSVLVAIGASMAALWLAFEFSVASNAGGSWRWTKGAGALVMGAAIVGMHYTGMAAASFSPTGERIGRVAPGIDHLVLGLGIGIATLMILGLALAGSVVDRKFAERRKRENILRESEERFRAAFEQAAVGISQNGPDGRWLRANQKLCEIVGYTCEELLEKRFQDITHSDDLEADLGHVRRLLAGEVETYSMEKRYLRRDGSVVWVNVALSLVREPSGEPKYFIAVVEDISERKILEQQLEHQAFHDPLTGLPNRALLLDRLGHALARTDRRGEYVAVLFLDLDGFKHINDSLGHEAGDRLLVDVAERLSRCVRTEDTIARFGGDEFVVLLEDLAGKEEAIRCAERLARQLRAPFMLSGEEVYVTISVGVVTSATPQDWAEDLLRDADAAMYEAKKKGKARYAMFDPSMKRRALERLKLENDLRRALQRSEFVIHYQPQVRLESGEILGLEALVRWRHPGRGLVLPGEFIPVAEESGLIVPIGRWVLREACRQTKEWQDQSPSGVPLRVCVNLSARQFGQPGLLAGEVTKALSETGLEPSSLTLEITESVLMEDASSSVDSLHRLKDRGVEISVDDFGTGYSSLSYLKRFPVDYIKVDRSFVAELGRGAEGDVIVPAVIDLAHTLGVEAVAEGVETAGQLARLRELGCAMGQGYYFAKPLPSKVIASLLAEGLSLPSQHLAGRLGAPLESA